MRTCLIVLILLFSWSSSKLAAQVAVPLAAETHLTQAYPEAQNPHWEYREGGLSALFTTNHQLVKVFYELGGQWRETRTRLSPAAFPEEVLSYIQEHFRNGFITYAGLVTSPQRKYYRIEAEYPHGVVIKLVNASGQAVAERWINYTR